MVVSHESKNTIKFLCSYGGKILPRSTDGKLRYVGGHTRLLSVGRSISFAGSLIVSLYLFWLLILRERGDISVCFPEFEWNCFGFVRAVGEAQRDVWILGEFEMPVANRWPRRPGFNNLRWRSGKPNWGIRSCFLSIVKFATDQDQSNYFPT